MPFLLFGFLSPLPEQINHSARTDTEHFHAEVADVLRKELRDLLREFAPLLAQLIREELAKAGDHQDPPLDTDQACRRLNISRRKLDDLVAAREIRPLRIGRKRLFPVSQLEAFLKRCER